MLVNQKLSDKHSELDLVLKNLVVWEHWSTCLHSNQRPKPRRPSVSFETRSHCVAQVVPKLLDASDSPTSAFKVAGTTQ